MRSPTWLLFKLAVCSIALMPFCAHADITAKECSILLTEQECNDFLQAQHQIQSPGDRDVFEREYAALLKERAQLCRCLIWEEIASAAKGTLPSKPFRSDNGKGNRTTM